MKFVLIVLAAAVLTTAGSFLSSPPACGQDKNCPRYACRSSADCIHCACAVPENGTGWGTCH